MLKCKDDSKNDLLKIINKIKGYLLDIYYQNGPKRIYIFEKLVKFLLFNLNTFYLHYNLIAPTSICDNFTVILIKKLNDITIDIQHLYDAQIITQKKMRHLTITTKKVLNTCNTYLFSKNKYLFKTILSPDIIREIITKWIIG